jgi:general secretion pathway protein H
MIKISAIGRRAGAGESCGQGRCAGFTLLELMVTLVIIVLISASMPIALNRLVPSYRFRAATEHLVTALQLARSHAQAQGRTVVLICNEAAFSIQATGTAKKVVPIPANSAISCTALPGGQAVDQLTLFPDGSATGGRIAVTDGKRTAAVELSALTGRIRVIG